MKKALLILFIIILTTGCKKGGKETPEISKIEKVLLVFPLKDETCTTGTISSAKESKVLFKWNSAANADNYELNLKNLLSSVTTSHATTNTEMDLTLLRNTPYSWYITARSSKTGATTQSDTWKLYNSGAGQVSYAPFPAEAVSPVHGQTVTATSGKVTLDWSAVDVDNDIKDYDLYFSTNKTPELSKSNIKESLSDNVTVIATTTYYWKIIVRDLKGNTSESDVFQFKTN